jgi:hypothetical protein
MLVKSMQCKKAHKKQTLRRSVFPNRNTSNFFWYHLNFCKYGSNKIIFIPITSDIWQKFLFCSFFMRLNCGKMPDV